MRITKSKYVSYCMCPKRFYLECFKPELMKKTEARERVLSRGTSVGDLAMGLFGDYIDVTTEKNGILDLEAMLAKTAECLNNNTTSICEASFKLEELYCAVDILHREGDGYAIYEVKSTTKPEAYHLIDVAFQTYVLKSLGLNIVSSNIVTLNSDYIRYGLLDIQKLFKIHNVTEEIKPLYAEVPVRLKEIKELLESRKCPNEDLKIECEKPYECPFKDYCYRLLPKNNVFSLVRFKKKLELYRAGFIGYEDIYNSPLYKKLTMTNKDLIEFELFDKPIRVNKEEIREFLDKITYPLYLLDFESIQPPVPLYNKTRPYQQIPFQYSLHIINSKGERPIHKEFLAEEGINPTKAIALSLIKDIPANATLMAYNISFESSRIKELALMYPSLKDELYARLSFIDLMEPFKNHAVYKKEFKGSYSIKYILPGLFPNDPELDYHNLNLIHNGSEAMDMYLDIMSYPKEERANIRECLLRYCELDTYAMVKILNKLYELAE